MQEPGDAFARSLLDAAAQLERDEQRIKRAVLEAVCRGDSAAAARIVQRWLDGPASQVLAAAESSASPGTSAIPTAN